MGRCPIGIVPGGFRRGGRKRGLQTDLQNEIVQEIETLLGRQSIARLGFRSHRNGGTPPDFALASVPWNNGSTPTPAITWDRSCPVAVEVPPSVMAVTKKTFASALGPLHLQPCNALTINCAIITVKVHGVSNCILMYINIGNGWIGVP